MTAPHSELGGRSGGSHGRHALDWLAPDAPASKRERVPAPPTASEKKTRAQSIVAFACGALFALGLGLSGMTKPSKVIGFLDMGGDWDPSLACVMGAAVAVSFVSYRLLRRRGRPVFAERADLPTKTRIDVSLVVGAAVFGVGWGLAGYCPGPAVVSAAGGSAKALVFFGFMAAGMLAASWLRRRAESAAADALPTSSGAPLPR